MQYLRSDTKEDKSMGKQLAHESLLALRYIEYFIVTTDAFYFQLEVNLSRWNILIF